MTQPDFNSSFRNLLNEPLPPAPDPSRIAFELFQREQRRTRVLAALSLLFWVLGTAGISILVFSLNHIAMQARIHSYGAPHAAVFPGAPDVTSAGPVEDPFFHALPPIAFTKVCAVVELSVVALLIAALLTVALIFSSRQATLNRINLSLMQIAEQMSRTSQAAPGGAAATGVVYSLPPAAGGFGINALRKMLITLVLVLFLLIGVPALWFAARSAASRHEAIAAQEAAHTVARWHGYPRLSPFEAVQWNDQTPQVQVRGRWYQLLSMNGLPTDQIIALCQALDPSNWQKRFEEDLVEVLMRTGHRAGRQAILGVKDLQTRRVEVLRDVPLTEENRQALWKAATTRKASDQ